jgi:hypothetical protein
MTRTAAHVQLPEQQRPHVSQPRVATGTDGSEWGDAALDWALRHASLLNAKLTVLAAKSADEQAIARGSTPTDGYARP